MTVPGYVPPIGERNTDNIIRSIRHLYENIDIRETLTENRTYYVRSDGSDTNDGLSNASGGAFATIQKAINVAALLDQSTFGTTIQIGAGTYTAANTFKSYLGVGPVVIIGDETTPSNVTLNTTSANGFSADSVLGVWEVRGFKFTTTTSGSAFRIINSTVKFKNCDFGAMAGGSSHIVARTNAVVITNGNYAISGGAGSHVNLQQGGIFLFGGGTTVTLTGTPAWATAFVDAKQLSLMQASGVTFSGSATGARYNLITNSVADTGGGGASFLPGNSAGSAATGGQYV